MLGFFDDEMKAAILKRIDDEGITDDNEKVVYMRASVIGRLESLCVSTFVEHEEEILAGTFSDSLIKHIPERERKAYEQCAKLSVRKIYQSKPVLDVELSGYRILETLMDVMIDAVYHPKRYYSQQLMMRVSSQYDIDSTDLQTRIMAVIDYICGMTDVYALDIYQKINGISLPIV